MQNVTTIKSLKEKATSNLKKLQKIFEKKKLSLEKSSSEYPYAIVIGPDKSTLKSVLSKYHCEKIISESEKMIRIHSYLVDNKGRINFREVGFQRLMLLFKNCNIKEIREEIQLSMEQLCLKNNWPKYSIDIYEGDPLNGNNINVEVKNPDPEADRQYYEDFGEVLRVERIKGRDHICFKSLNDFLPAIERYYKLKKKKKGKKRKVKTMQKKKVKTMQKKKVKTLSSAVFPLFVLISQQLLLFCLFSLLSEHSFFD